jgi:apolipoprotein D and lipocalin family protein
MRTFAMLALMLALDAQAAPPEPIGQLDLDRYLGRWHEVAKYPNRFQRQCVADTTATYERRDDGRIRVINRCRTANGEFDEAQGLARLVGEPGSATLEVRFAPAWLSWLPLVWGDYWVIDLDAAYTLAAVSDPDREYLWILARDPHIEEARVSALIERLGERGFDPSRIERAVTTR